MNRIILVATALALPQAAIAQSAQCLTRQEVGSLMAFAAPSIIEAASKKCSASLPANAFLRTGSGALAERLKTESSSDGQSLVAIVNKLGGGEKMPEGLSETTMRAFMGEVIGAEVAKDVNSGDCPVVDELVSAMAPLPARNLGTMIGAIMQLAGSSGKDAPFQICKAG